MEPIIAEAEVDALDLWGNYLWMIYCWWCLKILLSGSNIIDFIKKAQFMRPLRFPVENIQPLPWFHSKQHLYLFFRGRIATLRIRLNFALKFQILFAVTLWLRHPMVIIWSHTNILCWIIWWAFFFSGLFLKLTTSDYLWIAKALMSVLSF